VLQLGGAPNQPAMIWLPGSPESSGTLPAPPGPSIKRRLRLLRGHSLMSPFFFVFAVSRFCTTCAEAGQTHCEIPKSLPQMMARASEYFNQQDPLTDGFQHHELYVLDSLAEELTKI
jgi:hypothetical protein